MLRTDNQTSRENIAMHLRNVYDEAELSLEATRKDFLQVRAEGTRVVRRKITHYSLDAIISVGYRVKSTVATQFRIWATQRLKEHLLRGYTINENRLEQLGSIVTFLARNGVLYDSMGRVRVSNNTLAAITLMVAMSDPKEKDLMISLVTSMLSGSVP